MNGYSFGTYSGGTAFVGLGSFLPPFHISVGGTALQQASATSLAIGTGLGIYAAYAGFFDGKVRVSKKVARVDAYNATSFEIHEDVGVHWMDVPAGYFPLNIPAHVDDGKESFLLSALDLSCGQCIAEEVTASVKWMEYPAGYFSLNIPILTDNGHESFLVSALHPEATVCTARDAPVSVKWLEYTTDFVPSNIDLFSDEEAPFGHSTDMICPYDSERIERAFFTLRNPPTHVQLETTRVQSTIDTLPGPAHLVTALNIALFMTLSTMFLVFKSLHLKMKLPVFDEEPFGYYLELQPNENTKKKALEAALYKLGATPVCRVGGSRHPNKKARKKKKSTNNTIDVEKHSFSIASALESLD